jgi:mycothiol synthase
METVNPLQPEDLSDALELLLAVPGSKHRASEAAVRGFLTYLERGALRWEGLGCRSRGTFTGLSLSLLIPGATAIVMIPTPGELGISPATQTRVAAAGLDRLRAFRLHYVQALLWPDARAQQDLLSRLGFAALAPLLYLARDVTYPWVEPPNPTDGAWIPFGTQTRAEFARVLTESYVDSLDCPELTGLRPIDDVIAAHQSSGQFDPALWELLDIGGQPAGCVLLARLPDAGALDLVYMGVVPRFRRRGVGALLVRRAFQRCRESRARRLSVVVDQRNAPALRLYERYGLRPAARRAAYWFRWPAEAPNR